MIDTPALRILHISEARGKSAAEVRDTVLLDLSDPGRLLPWPQGVYFQWAPPKGRRQHPHVLPAQWPPNPAHEQSRWLLGRRRHRLNPTGFSHADIQNTTVWYSFEESAMDPQMPKLARRIKLLPI